MKRIKQGLSNQIRISFLMKMKVFCTLLILLGLVLPVKAQQVAVSLLPPPPNQLNVEDLWRLTLTNNSADAIQVILRGEALEKTEGLLFEASSSVFMLEPGFTTVMAGEIGPIDVGYGNPEYQEYISRTGSAPSGTYTVCVNAVTAETMEVLGSDCIQQSIEEIPPPELVSPLNGDVVMEEYPLFSWQVNPEQTGDVGINYTLRIVELLGNQSPYEAMESNPAWFEESGISMNSFTYPVGARSFNEGGFEGMNIEEYFREMDSYPENTYCWQVQSFDEDDNPLGENEGKSEVWVFGVAAMAQSADEPDTSDGSPQPFSLDYFDPDTIDIGVETEVRLVGQGFTEDMEVFLPYEDIHVTGSQFIDAQNLLLTIHPDDDNEPGTYSAEVTGPDGQVRSKSIETVAEDCKRILQEIKEKEKEVEAIDKRCDSIRERVAYLEARAANRERAKNAIEQRIDQLENDRDAEEQKIKDAESTLKGFIDQTFYTDFIGSDPSKGENSMNVGGNVNIYFSGSSTAIHWLRWFWRTFREDIKEQNEKIREARSEIARINDEIEREKERLDDLNAAIDDIENDLKAAKQELDDCEQAKKTLEDEIKELIAKHQYCTSWLKRKRDAKESVEKAKKDVQSAGGQEKASGEEVDGVGNKQADSLMSEARKKLDEAEDLIRQAEQDLKDGKLNAAKAKAAQAGRLAKAAKKDAEDAAAIIECANNDVKYVLIESRSYTVVDESRKIDIKHAVTGDRITEDMLKRGLTFVLKRIFKRIVGSQVPDVSSTSAKNVYDIYIPVKVVTLEKKEKYRCVRGRWTFEKIERDKKNSRRRVIRHRVWTRKALIIYFRDAENGIMGSYVDRARYLRNLGKDSW